MPTSYWMSHMKSNIEVFVRANVRLCPLVSAAQFSVVNTYVHSGQCPLVSARVRRSVFFFFDKLLLSFLSSTLT